MKDYEQLYYNLFFENRQLKRKINELESDLNLVNKKDKNKIELKKEIIKEINEHFKNKKGKEK